MPDVVRIFLFVEGGKEAEKGHGSADTEVVRR